MTLEQFEQIYNHWIDSRHAMFFKGLRNWPLIIMATPKGPAHDMVLEGYVIESDTTLYTPGYASKWNAELFEHVKGQVTFTPEDNE